MNVYDVTYKKLIEPLYGNKRNENDDSELLQSNILPHPYSINERVDMTMHETYSIDPDGCEDADDAFSIFKENDKIFMERHGKTCSYKISVLCSSHPYDSTRNYGKIEFNGQ
jgi:hypothetical protein